MEQYEFTAATKVYTITLDVGSTVIDAGYNAEYNLYEKWRQLEFFASDVQKKIIIKFSREFYTANGIKVNIPGIKSEDLYEIEDKSAVYSTDENGNQIEVSPASVKFTFWDSALGIPLIRKFVANGIMEKFGLNPYFDQNSLLGN